MSGFRFALGAAMLVAMVGPAGAQSAAGDPEVAKIKGSLRQVQPAAAPEEEQSGTVSDGSSEPIDDRRAFSLARAAPAAKSGVAQKSLVPTSSAVRNRRPASSFGTRRAASPAGGTSIELPFAFALNSVELTDESKRKADKWAQAMNDAEFGTAVWLIEGHTDSTGSYARNMALSEGRAKAVVDYLSAHGVDRKKLQAVGVGPNAPRKDLRPADPANRRVEIRRAS